MGLQLLVKGSGARSWVLRIVHRGRRLDIGLGGWPAVSLARAREKALESRARGADGVDPRPQRHQQQTLTFKEMAEALIESKRVGWRNEKHAAQWSSTLATYAYPSLGRTDVAAVDTEAVLAVLRPIRTTKPETASQVRQRIEAALNYAAATKARTGENPARWRGHLDHLLPQPSKVRAVKHHAALDWREAPGFSRACWGATALRPVPLGSPS